MTVLEFIASMVGLLVGFVLLYYMGAIVLSLFYLLVKGLHWILVKTINAIY